MNTPSIDRQRLFQAAFPEIFISTIPAMISAPAISRPGVAASPSTITPTAKAPMLAGRYWVIPNRNRGALPGELVFSGNGADPVFEPGRDWVRSSLVRGRYEAEGLVITIAGTTAHDMVGRYVFTTADCDPPSGTCRAFVEGGGYDLILLPNTM